VPALSALRALAEEQSVSDVSGTNPERKVTVAARVPPALAEAVAALGVGDTSQQYGGTPITEPATVLGWH
jgi:hypothetical protein